MTQDGEGGSVDGSVDGDVERGTVQPRPGVPRARSAQDDPLARLREEASPSPMVDIWLTEDGVRRLDRRPHPDGPDGPQEQDGPDDDGTTTDGG